MNLKVKAVLDPAFQPMSVLLRDYSAAVRAAKSQKLVVSIVRNQGYTSSYALDVFADGTGHDEENIRVIERVVKTLLWIKGGYKIVISGSRVIYDAIAEAYKVGGARDFDNDFMSGVYERPFETEYIEKAEDAPATHEASASVGRHLDGCRIGFDAGGSDRKVSAVVDGETVYSEEVIWHPKKNSDPHYHFDGILDAFRTAASKMPRVDAIGVSSAGVYIDNKAMVASLFIEVPKTPENFEFTKNIYLNAARALDPNVPIEVANDGDVTALAGAMDLNDDSVLGIAMGTSEAGGYVDASGNITGWLNELAFVPVDANPDAMRDEWSGDVGCGVKYFSQDAVIKLCPAAGVELPEELTLAEKLKFVQNLQAQGDPRTRGIYETIGVYFGYEIAYYAMFYDIKHVLIMGRVTSGTGGVLLLDKAKEVLETEFPELAKKIALNIPDENSRRVGQSVAAASLPAINK